jgi:hypothetical protein
VDHLPARPGHREARRPGRSAADELVRSAGPGPDQPPDYPGERLVTCRSPLQAAQRARTRTDRLAATEALLVLIITAVEQGRLAGADATGIKVGKLINRYKMTKHFDVAITDTSLTLTRRASQIAAEAALEGIYVIRTSVPAATLDAPATVIAYKNLAHLEPKPASQTNPQLKRAAHVQDQETSA